MGSGTTCPQLWARDWWRHSRLSGAVAAFHHNALFYLPPLIAFFLAVVP